jgi:hypothetical protein
VDDDGWIDCPSQIKMHACSVVQVTYSDDGWTSCGGGLQRTNLNMARVMIGFSLTTAVLTTAVVHHRGTAQSTTTTIFSMHASYSHNQASLTAGVSSTHLYVSLDYDFFWEGLLSTPQYCCYICKDSLHILSENASPTPCIKRPSILPHQSPFHPIPIPYPL